MIHNPKHPGVMVNNLCLKPLHLSVSDAAKALKVTRPTLSKLLNGHMGISPEMAIRLSIVFDTSAEFWINLQAAYELWEAEKKRKKLGLKPLDNIKAA
jgi:addiction module HigA family antidote